MNHRAGALLWMLRITVLAAAMLPAIASAAPKPRCLDTGENGSKVRLVSDGSRATLCFPDGCLAYAPGRAADPIKPRPMPMFVPEAEVREDRGRLAACTGSKCDPLGPKLAAAIAAAHKDGECLKCDPRPGPPMLSAARDRAFVLLANTRGEPAWNVADDKPIDFAARRRLERSLGTPRLAGVSVAGNHILVSWYVCPAGKSNSIACEVDELMKTTIADEKGRDLGGTFEDFSTIRKVAGDRYVTTGGDAGAIQLVDGGRITSQLAFPWKYPYYQQHAQIDADHLAVVWGRGDRYHLSLITVGKTALTAVELESFPVCSP
jgi:hypothetical protein